VRDVVVIGDGFGSDEAPLEIGVDHAGSLRRLGALGDGPRSRLLWAHGEERNQMQQRVACADEAIETGFL
jgi:hypothetical protein